MPRTALLEELRNISRTLSTGIPAQGKGKLAAESLLHHQAKDRYVMGRQKELDALERPGLELQRDKAQAAIDRRRTPVTLTTLSGGNLWQMGHWISKGKGEGDTSPMYDELAQAYGANFDEKKDSSTYGQMVRDDGTVVTQGDLDDNPELAQSIVVGNTDVMRHARDVVEQIDTHKRASKTAAKEGWKVNPDEEAKIDAAGAKAAHFLNSPKLQIEAMENQVQWLSKFRGPGWEKGIARVQKKIDRTQKQYLGELMLAAKAVAAKATEKDTRSTMEKEVALMQRAYGLNQADATNLWRTDEALREKLRAYAEYIKSAPMDIQLDSKAMDEYNKTALRLFGLDKPSRPGGPKEGVVEQDANNPLGLKIPTVEDLGAMQ